MGLKFGLKGYTLMEMMIVAAVVAMLMAAIVPYFYTIRTTGFYSERRNEVLQNGRIAMDKMVQELRPVKRILSVTDPAEINGRIVFIDREGNQVEFKKYSDGTKEMLGYVQGGVTYPLAGPISSLKFDARKIDAATSTTVASLIKSLGIELTVKDTEGKISSQTFTSLVYFRKNFLGALYYVCFSNNNVRLNGSGTIVGDIQANNRVTEAGSIVVQGTITDRRNGINIPLPKVDFDNYTVGYTNYKDYEKIADYVSQTDFTFRTNQSPYSGIYYLKGSATFQRNVLLNGSVIAEKNIIISGRDVTLNPSGSNPAAIAADTFSIDNRNFFSLGPIYALNDINVNGQNARINPTPESDLAVVAADSILLSQRYFLAKGSLIALGNITISGRNVTLEATGNYPSILSGGDLQVTSRDFTSRGGLIFAAKNAFFGNDGVIISGIVMSGDTLRFSKSVNINYDANILSNPPPFVYEP